MIQNSQYTRSVIQNQTLRPAQETDFANATIYTNQTSMLYKPMTCREMALETRKQVTLFHSVKLPKGRDALTQYILQTPPNPAIKRPRTKSPDTYLVKGEITHYLQEQVTQIERCRRWLNTNSDLIFLMENRQNAVNAETVDKLQILETLDIEIQALTNAITKYKTRNHKIQETIAKWQHLSDIFSQRKEQQLVANAEIEESAKAEYEKAHDEHTRLSQKKTKLIAQIKATQEAIFETQVKEITKYRALVNNHAEKDEFNRLLQSISLRQKERDAVQFEVDRLERTLEAAKGTTAGLQAELNALVDRRKQEEKNLRTAKQKLSSTPASSVSALKQQLIMLKCAKRNV